MRAWKTLRGGEDTKVRGWLAQKPSLPSTHTPRACPSPGHRPGSRSPPGLGNAQEPLGPRAPRQRHAPPTAHCPGAARLTYLGAWVTLLSRGARLSLRTLQKAKAKAMTAALEGGKGSGPSFLGAWAPPSWPLVHSICSPDGASTRKGAPVGRGGAPVGTGRRPSGRQWNQTRCQQGYDMDPREHTPASRQEGAGERRSRRRSSWQKFPNVPATLQSAGALGADGASRGHA